MSDAAARMPTMQLVAQDYAEVLAALKAAADTTGHERRGTARMEVMAQVKVFPYKDGQLGPPFTCLTRDLSFRGVGLFQAKAPPRGSQFVVILPRREDAATLSLLCTVMYCRTMADGLFNVGAAFVKPFDVNAKPAAEVRGASAAPAAKSGAQSGAKSPAPASTADAEMNRIRQSILG
jgi:hypothetical protein